MTFSPPTEEVPTSDLNELFADLTSLGWLVNNCYQPDGGLWRVSLRRPCVEDDIPGDYVSEWGEGPSLADALEECMSKLHAAEFVPDAVTTFVVQNQVSISQQMREMIRNNRISPIIRRKI